MAPLSGPIQRNWPSEVMWREKRPMSSAIQASSSATTRWFIASDPSRNCEVGKRTSSTRSERMVVISGVHRALALLAQALDAQAHRLPRHQVLGRLLAQAHTGRRAGSDHVAGLQAHEAAQVAHELLHAEPHGAGVAVLEAVAIDLKPQVEVLRVGHVVGRHKPGADRAEGVAALALVPLAAALELVLALRHVVHHAVAGHVLQSV